MRTSLIAAAATAGIVGVLSLMIYCSTPLTDEQAEARSIEWTKNQGLMLVGTQCHESDSKAHRYCEVTVRNADTSLEVHALHCFRDRCRTVPRYVE